MRYAVLSDIHANLEALTAVMDALSTEQIDRYLCLGDIVGYGADPSACLARLQACDAVMVGGNHDLACVGKLDLDWFHRTAKAALVWTRDQLNFTDLDTLRRLPLTTTLESFTLVHATLTHPKRFDYLIDMAQAIDMMQACHTLMCLAGHTHLPCCMEYERSQHRVLRWLTSPQELTEVVYVDDNQTRWYLVNPGSVGQPRDGDPRASMAIIDTAKKWLSIRRISYDVATAQRKIRQAGLPAFLADRLASGR